MKNRRPAFTLIEMLVALAVFSAVFGTVSLSLFAMFRSSQRLSDAVSAIAQQQRFASQLRNDAHVAATARAISPHEPGSRATTLELSWPDGRSVHYRLEQQHIERELRAGDASVAVDSFSVVPDSAGGWNVEPRGSSALVTINLLTRAPGDPAAVQNGRPVPVQAAVGLPGLRGERPIAGQQPPVEATE